MSTGSTTQTVNSAVSARIGPPAGAAAPVSVTTITSTGDVVVKAMNGQSATAIADRSGGGAISVSAMSATTTVTGRADAFVGRNVHLTASGLTIHGELTRGGRVVEHDLQQLGGGVNVAAPSVTATATPTVTSGIGEDAVITTTAGVGGGGDVIVEAIGRGEVDATGEVYGGGVVSIGTPHATASVRPTVAASIGTGTTIGADGAVKVTAALTTSPIKAPPSDVITDVDTSDTAWDPSTPPTR